jgi:gliding-associated putative ABC transporter substrate-binding component GldG
MSAKKKFQIGILIVLLIIVLINLVSTKLFLRLDFTEDQRYTLSKATKKILKELDEPATIIAYFSENVPPDIMRNRNEFRELLSEYSSISGNMVVYEFVNPNESPERETEAQQEGIRPIMISVRERDQMKQQRAYLGAVIKIGDKKEVIPFIQPGSSMEYELTTKLRKLTLKEKTKVGYITGYGEPEMDEVVQLIEELKTLYDVEQFNLKEKNEISNEYKALIWISPKDTVTYEKFDILNKYLQNGGNMLIAFDAVQGDFKTVQGNEVKTNAFEFLKDKNVEIEKKFLIDASASNVTVTQQQGFFQFQVQVPFPYIPISTNFEKHPTTSGLNNLVFPFVSPIKINNKDTSIVVQKLILSSDNSGTLNPPLFFEVEKNWKKTDFPLSKIPIAVAVENYKGFKNKMVVIGDGDFVVNGKGESAQRVNPDNINFIANAIEWLTDASGLAEVRTKTIALRQIDPKIEDATKTILKYVNFLAPILLVIGYGIFRYQRNLIRQTKIKAEDYV